MQRSKTVTVGERDITVKELTVSQIRDLMDNLEKDTETYTIDMLFPDSVPAIAVSESTGIPIKKLEADFTPSELKQIIEGVENLNPFFTNMISRIAKIGEAVLTEKASMPSAAD